MTACTKCKTLKPDSSFYRNISKSNGLYSFCKDCHNSLTRKNRDRKSKKEIILSRWHAINARCGKLKGYKDIKNLISKKDFIEMMDNPSFAKMYNTWVESGFQNSLSPSVDRIKPDGHYCKDNIQWLTWGDNAKKAARVNRRKTQPVFQHDLDGVLLREYVSFADAARTVTGSTKATGNISKCARGELKTAYGFIWKVN